MRYFIGDIVFLILVSSPFVSLNAAAADRDDVSVSIVVADFDYYDASGEASDQTAQHGARIALFTNVLREHLATRAGYTVQRLECGKPNCTAGDMEPEALINAALTAGGRLLVYGGIQKMSTLVQWGKVYVIDLAQDQLLLDRLFSFRGDNKQSFSHAAEFIAQNLERVTSGEPASNPY